MNPRGCSYNNLEIFHPPHNLNVGVNTLMCPNKFCHMFLCTSLVSLLAAGSSHASDIEINQAGQRSKAKLEVKSNIDVYKAKLQQSGIENMLDVGISNNVDATIRQNGDYGVIKLQLEGRNDLLRVEQSGLHNNLAGTFSGNDNETNIEQLGANNLINIDAGGQHNVINLHQSGYNNNLDVVQNSNNNRLDLEQLGSSNIMRVDHSSSNVGLDITQDGNRGSVVITN